jgi:hypothetical protein
MYDIIQGIVIVFRLHEVFIHELCLLSLFYIVTIFILFIKEILL